MLQRFIKRKILTVSTVVTVLAYIVVFVIAALAESKLRRQEHNEQHRIDPSDITDNEY